MQSNRKGSFKATEAKLSVFLASVSIALIFLMFEVFATKVVMNDVSEEVTRSKSDFQKQLSSFISRQLLHFEFLQSADAVKAFASALASADENPETLHPLFNNYLSTHPEAYQARIISLRPDDLGQEVVKVVREGDQFTEIIGQQLQSKLTRSYFQPSADLELGQFFVSRISLNKENGVIELPTKPTIRISTPLFVDQSNPSKISKVGFLIVNISLNQFFESFASALPSYASFMITSLNDEVIFHSSPEKMANIQSSTPVFLNNLYLRGEITSDGFSWVQSESNPDQSLHMYQALLNLSDDYTNVKVNAYMMANESHVIELINQKRMVFYPLVLLILSVALWFIAKLYKISQQHASLATARKQTDAYVQGSSNPIIIFDDLCKVLSLNEQAIILFGFRKKEAEGALISYLIKSLDSKWHKLLLEALTPAQDKRQDLCIFDKPEQTWFRLHIKEIGSHQGVYAAEYQDTTAEVSSKNELERINNELEKRVEARTQQLSELYEQANAATELKSRFISNVSHEMRTPLNGLLGAITVLQRIEHEPGIQKYLDIASVSGKQLGTLINDVLDISKIESGKMQLTLEQFDVLPVFEQLIDSFAMHASEKGIRLFIDTSELKLQSIKSDKQRLIQIVNNLLSNAVKFTQSGYVLLRLIGSIDQDEQHARLKIVVKDTGVGISEKSQSKLFNYFIQAEDKVSTKHKGTGLGLVITQHLCVLLNGSIEMQSKYGVGSTFTASISSRSWKAFEAVRQNVLSKWKCQIVTEDDAFYKCVTHMLSSLGGEVLEHKPLDIIGMLDNGPLVDDVQKKLVIFVDDTSNQFSKIGNLLNESAQVSSHRIVIVSDRSEQQVKMGSAKNILTLTLPVKETDLIKAARQSFKLKKKAKNLQQKKTNISINSKVQGIVSNKHVLIVDDNEINIEVAKSLLASLPIVCHSASNGSEAIETINTMNKKNISFSTILMDCFMPEMDGYETSRNIRRGMAGDINRAIPIIAMTANAVSGSKEKCIEAGMTGYLTKPLDEESLLENVSNAICMHHEYGKPKKLL